MPHSGTPGASNRLPKWIMRRMTDVRLDGFVWCWRLVQVCALMSRFLGRDSRRRRVLNEEALSASAAHLALRAVTPDEPAEGAPRYGEAALREEQWRVTDLLPHRFRTIGVLAAAALLTIAAVEALHWFVAPVAGTYGFDTAAAFDLAGPRGLAAWFAAMVLALASATSALVYSLRRHRIDDFHGRYRVWLAAAVACALLSIESVAPTHRLWSAAAAYYTGWTALRDHAAWWLLLAGPPLVWIALRTWLDARESRLAAATLGLAFIACGVSLGSYLGLGPAIASPMEVMVTSGAMLAGQWLLLLGIVSYGRFVVRDAEGLNPAGPRERTAKKSVELSVAVVTKDREVKHVGPSTTPAAASAPLRAFRENAERATPAESKPTQWVDGSEPEAEIYDDGEQADYSGRKLSKADRKRLRRQKRAA